MAAVSIVSTTHSHLECAFALMNKSALSLSQYETAEGLQIISEHWTDGRWGLCVAVQ